MGGTVAYEMARQLNARGEKVERLLLIDASIPAFGHMFMEGQLRLFANVRREYTADEKKVAIFRLVWIVMVAHMIADRGDKKAAHVLESIDPTHYLELSPAERDNFIASKAQELNLLPPGAGLSAVQRYLTISEAMYDAFLEYDLTTCEADTVLFEATDQTPDRPRAPRDATLQHWERAVRKLEVRTIPACTHYSIINSPEFWKILGDYS